MYSVLLAALFAGIVAILVTVAIEKWGGIIRGILGTLPTTIVPATIGMYIEGGSDDLATSTVSYTHLTLPTIYSV